MAQRYHDPRYTLDGVDVSVFQGGGAELSVMSIDNRTINSPPEPVAASTVNRTSANRPKANRPRNVPVQLVPPVAMMGERNNLPADPRGSFLDNASWSMPPSPGDEPRQNKPPIVRMSFSDIEHPVHAVGRQGLGRMISANASKSDDQMYGIGQREGFDKSGMYPVGLNQGDLSARSSLGILPAELLADTSFGIGSIPSDELLRFGTDACKSNSSSGILSKQTSLDSVNNTSKDSKGGDSCSEQPIGRSRGIETIKKRPTTTAEQRFPKPMNPISATTSAVLGLGGSTGGMDEGDQDESVHEVQFEAAELADLDDDFGDFGELQYDDAYTSESEHVPENQASEKGLVDVGYGNNISVRGDQDWYQYFQQGALPHQNGDGEEAGHGLNLSPVHFYDDEVGIEGEMMPTAGMLHDASDIDTEDELEAVRRAMAVTGGDNRQNGVGGSEDSGEDRSRSARPGLEGRSDHCMDSFGRPEQDLSVRQSAEGEVVTSPVPGDGGGGGDGSSAPGSEDERFGSDDLVPQAFTRPQDSRYLPQDERRFRPVGDDTDMTDASGMISSTAIGNGLLDSQYFRPGRSDRVSQMFGEQSTCNMAGRESQAPLGFAEQSSFNMEAEMQALQQVQTGEEPRLEAPGFNMDDQQLEGLNPFDGQDPIDSPFDNSLGSFGASPERMEDKEEHDGGIMNEVHRSCGTGAPLSGGHKNLDRSSVYYGEQRPVTDQGKQKGKRFVSDKSPVYMDENGQGVTDLAFQTSLVDEAAYQQQLFAEITEDLPQEDPMAASVRIQDDEFFGSDDALAMLAEDEKNFKDDNIFMQDDQMVVGGSGPKLHDESWCFKSSVYLASSAVPHDDYADACMRISIGEFMRSRSGPLGSLGDDPYADRPHFGNKIITPPINRQPCTLLPCSITQVGGVVEDSNTGSGANQRSEGVGIDETGKPGAEEDPPMTLDDIGENSAKTVGNSAIKSVEQSSYTSTDPTEVTPRNSSQGDLDSASRLSEISLSDKTGVLSISAITSLMTSADANYDPVEMMHRIMALSSAKALEKKSKETQAETNSQVSAKQACQKPLSKPYVSRLPVRKGSSGSPKVDEQQQQQAIERDSRRVGHPQQVKTKPRTQTTGGTTQTHPAGNTEPPFNPSQTYTQKYRTPLHNVAEPGKREVAQIPQHQGTKNAQSTSYDHHIPCPDGQESDRSTVTVQLNEKSNNRANMKPKLSEHQPFAPPVDGKSSSPTSANDNSGSPKWMSPRLSVGHFMDGSDKGKQTRPSQMSPQGSSPGSEGGKPAVPQSRGASELTSNLSVDVSVVEQIADYTFQEDHGQVDERRFSPADGRDTDGLESAAKIGTKSDSQIFKKPQTLPLKRNLKPNKQPRESSVILKSRGSSQNVYGRQQVVGRRDGVRKRNEVAVEADPNKENLLDKAVNKPGILDKITVMQNSDMEEPVYRSRASKPNQTSRIQARVDHSSVTESSRPAPGVQHCQPLREIRTDAHDVMTGKQPPSNSSNISNNSAFSARPSQNPTQIPATHCPPNIRTHSLEQVRNFTSHTNPRMHSPHPDIASHQLNTDAHQMHSLPQLPNQIWPQAAPAQTEERPSQGPDLFTPRQFSCQPYLGGNLLTPSPTKYAALVSQDTLSFNQKTPACQSTPFYQRLLPCDTSNIEDVPGSELNTPAMTSGLPGNLASTYQPRQYQALVQADDTMETKTPNVAADFRRTAPMMIQSVEVPRELRFQEICCVGVSTKADLPIHNPTNRWLECLLEITQLNINGKNVHPGQNSPFMFKSKTIVEPKSSDKLSVVFIPKHEGVYVAQLSVYACPVVQNQRTVPLANRVAETITLQAMAEIPDIQIVTETPKCLLFGQLPWGSCKGLPLTLVNRGKATIPLRLAISANTSSWHCFSFEQSPSGDVSIISHSSRPPTPALSKSVLNVTLNSSEGTPQSSVAQLNIYCKVPERQWSMATSNFPPEDIQAKVEVEVDTPSAKLLLGTIGLQALAGSVKLQIPRSLEVVQLSSTGESISTSITLRNSGNIDMQLALAAADYQEEFIVAPSNITVKPDQGEELWVQFRPRSTQPSNLQTLLLMFLEPDGPVYELPLRGTVVQPTQPAVELLCSKHFLSFGGMNIGKSVSQKMTLIHKSKESVKFKLEIRTENPSDFQIKSGLGPSERLSSVKDIIIKSEEEFPVHVTCSPSSFAQVTGKLLIKQAGCLKKYTVPLSGYGGTSQLVLQDSADTTKGGNYYRNIGEMHLGQNNIQEITVWNIGTRAAFVKALCLSDRSCSHILDGNVAVVQPNEFVIKAGASKTVVLVLTPTIRETTLCKDKQFVVAVVKFYYGDEMSRRAFRKAVRANSASDVSIKKTFPKNHPLINVNFDVRFQDENDLEEGVEHFVGMSNDVQMFYKSIANFVLSLVGDPPRPSSDCDMVPGTRLHQNRQPRDVRGLASTSSPTETLKAKLSNAQTVYPDRPSISRDTESEYRPQINTPVNPVSSLSNRPPMQDVPTKKLANAREQNTKDIPTNPRGKLEIHPDQVILELTTDGKATGLGQIKVLNYSNAEIRFDVSWPAHRITVDPDGGTVEPMGMCSVFVSPSVQLVKQGIPLPWSGNFTISSQDENKVVSVLIRRSSSEVSPVVPSNQRKLSQSSKQNRSLQPIPPKKTLPTTKRSMEPGLARETSGSVQRQKPSSTLSKHSNRPGSPIDGTTANKSTSQSTSSDDRSQKLAFPQTHVGETTETTLVLTNKSDKIMNWSLSAFVQPYMKILGAGSSDVRRVQYDVFKFRRLTGQMGPLDAIKVCVQFAPQDSGYFTQYWEAQSRHGDSMKTFLKIQLTGEAMPSSSPGETSSQDRTRSEPNSSMSRMTKGTVLSLLSKSIDFPTCAVGQSKASTIEVKNSDSIPHVLEVIQPQPPFFVKHSKVKVRGGHFVKLPIHFKPSQKGSYETLIVVRPDVGQSLNLPLKGTCA